MIVIGLEHCLDYYLLSTWNNRNDESPSTENDGASMVMGISLGNIEYVTVSVARTAIMGFYLSSYN